MAELRLARTLSRAFRIAVKFDDPRPQWRIAAAADVSPHLLSQWMSGYGRVRADDPRLLRVAAEVGVPPERLFESPVDAVAPSVARVLGLSADQTFAREPEESIPPIDGDDSAA